jgi:hypothetical protein
MWGIVLNKRAIFEPGVFGRILDQHDIVSLNSMSAETRLVGDLLQIPTDIGFCALGLGA